ncbi:MAG: hypothetical protein JWN48_4049, partial [Myxococcaceae bacterium]|nr:hypothetical protein [Myxococcaceae bacterium]
VVPLPPPTPAAPQPAEAPAVGVAVSTEPEGASVSVDGHSVCRATPCRFETPRGRAIHVLVQKPGYRSGRIDLTPERELNRLDLALSRRRGGAPGGNRMEGDLMLPDAFGKR